MPLKLNQKGRDRFFLFLRLAVFTVIIYFAINLFLLRKAEERSLDLVDQSLSTIRFRAHGKEYEERKISILGKIFFEMTLVQREASHRKQGRALVWLQEGAIFYPRRGSKTTIVPGTNYFDYMVTPPAISSAWIFKAEHTISRKIRVGPFSIKGSRKIIYSSPLMTNGLRTHSAFVSLTTVSDSSEPKQPLQRITP